MAKKKTATINTETQKGATTTMNITAAIALINLASEAFSKVIAGILSQSGLTAEEIRANRDKLSADTHSIVEQELAKLG